MSLYGKFIVIEGIDGCGKSSQAKALVEEINKVWIPLGGKECVYEREPNDMDPVGKLVRSSLAKEIALVPETMTLLNVASRIEHVRHIQKLLAEGHCVVCDRYYLSNMAYNQTAKLSMEDIFNLNQVVRDTITPDMILFMNITFEESKRRRSGDNTRTQEELYETEQMQRAVRERFMSILDFLKDKENLVLIDAMPDYETVRSRLWQAVRPLFKNE